MLSGIFITIIIDLSFVKVYDLINKDFIPIERKELIFFVNSLICFLLQFLLIHYLNGILIQPRFVNLGYKKYYIFSVSAFLLTGILVSSLAFQQIFENYYSTFLLLVLSAIAYIIPILILSKLLSLFIEWFRYNKKIILLLYLISITFIILNLMTAVIYTIIKLSNQPERIIQYIGGTVDVYLSKDYFIQLLFNIFSVASFLSLWVTTLVIFLNYKYKLSRNILIGVLLSLPLLYYISTFFMGKLFSFFVLNTHVDPFLLSIVFITISSLSKPIGGVIFGIVFLSISKFIKYEKDISAFVLIAGFGILLIFCTNQSMLLSNTPYPPFGVATITILNIAAYLLTIGLYNTAKLVSYNNQLRHSILKMTSNSKLISFMGLAQQEKEMEKLVSVIENNLKDVQPKSIEKDSLEFDQSELKKYIEELADELSKERKDKDNGE